MDAKHTPGPWTLETVKTAVGICHKIGTFPQRGVRETTSACIYGDNIAIEDDKYGGIASELMANARLIAAAPDLLAACKEALLALREIPNYVPHGSKTREKGIYAMALCESAIAKAVR